MTAAAPRLERIRAALDGANIDGLLISNPHNRRYASGFSGSNGWLLISVRAEQPPRLATDFRYLDQAAQEAPEFEIVTMKGGIEKWWAEFVAPLGRGRLGFESSDVTVATHKQLRDVNAKLPASQRPALIQTNRIVEQVRAIKEEAEQTLLREAARLTDDAFAHAERELQTKSVDWTERDVAWEIERFARSHGAEAMAFESIVASGPWGARPHARPRDAIISHGEPIVIDMGARWRGYCADMTRTIVLGEHGEQFPRIYDIVLAAHETAAEMIEPGMSGKDADQLARQVISDAGYGDQYGHGLGHGVGLQIHESPYLGTTSTDTLAAGMVMTIEPGIYLPDWGGVRIEDMGLLDDDGFHSFTGTPKLRLLSKA